MPEQPSPVLAAVPSADHPNGLLTADQLAERWQVSKEQVYRLSRSGQISTVRVGRYFRYRVASIEAWELESETTDA